jgi:hypothetical protein
MCFKTPKAPAAPPPPPVPAPPVTADEENRRAVAMQIQDQRQRKGRETTIVTGGLGDVGYGSSQTAPMLTRLGG